MSSKDDLGDRMKQYERLRSVVLSKDYPIIVRLDGKAFHTFTKGLARPFDENFSMCMEHAARYCMEQSGADLTYTQSDEITLVFLPKGGTSEMYFGGKQQKLCSVLASMASVAFFQAMQTYLPSKALTVAMPVFDGRAFNVADKEEAANCLLWRMNDCTKNAIQMIARSHYSHNQLRGKSQADQIRMICECGDSIENYAPRYLRGIILRRVTEQRTLTEDELSRMPVWRAAQVRDEPVVRSRIARWEHDFYHPMDLLG